MSFSRIPKLLRRSSPIASSSCSIKKSLETKFVSRDQPIRSFHSSTTNSSIGTSYTALGLGSAGIISMCSGVLAMEEMGIAIGLGLFGSAGVFVYVMGEKEKKMKREHLDQVYKDLKINELHKDAIEAVLTLLKMEYATSTVLDSEAKESTPDKAREWLVNQMSQLKHKLKTNKSSLIFEAMPKDDQQMLLCSMRKIFMPVNEYHVNEGLFRKYTLQLCDYVALQNTIYWEKHELTSRNPCAGMH